MEASFSSIQTVRNRAREIAKQIQESASKSAYLSGRRKEPPSSSTLTHTHTRAHVHTCIRAHALIRRHIES